MESEKKMSEGANNKKVPLDDLPKDELIKKCKSFLGIAQKAKQSKDEMMEEFKKLKESEAKLQSDNAALQEVVNSLTEKQTDSAEHEVKVKQLKKKSTELEKLVKSLEEKNAKQILDNVTLKETLQKLTNKISNMEIQQTDEQEKYNQLELKLNEYQQVITKKETEIKELTQEYNKSEEKYKNLELTVKEFETKYKEESQNFDLLNDQLKKLQDRPSSQNSDSLKTVSENLEFENLQAKYEELIKQRDDLKQDVDRLTRELNKSLTLNSGLKNKFSDDIDKLNETASGQLESAQAYMLEIQELKHLLVVKNNEIELLQQNTQEYENKLQIFNTKFENDLKCISENDKKLHLQLEETNEGIDERSKQISELKDKLGLLEHELGDLTLMLEEAMNKISSYESNELLELKQLQEKLLSYREIEETFELTRNEQKKIIKELQEEVEELKLISGDLIKTEDLLSELQNKFSDLKQVYDDEKKNSEQLNVLVQKLQTEISKLYQDLVDISNKTEQLSKRCFTLEDNCKFEKEENERLNNIIKNNEVEYNTKLTNVAEKYDGLSGENERLQNNTRELEIKLGDEEKIRLELVSKLEEKIKHDDKQIQDNHMFVQQVSELEERASQMQIEIKKYQLKIANLEKINKKNKQLKLNVALTNKKITRSEDDINQLRTDLERKEKEIQSDLKKINELNETLVNKNEELEGIYTVMNELKTQSAKNVDSLRDSLIKEQSLVEQLQQETNLFKQQLAEANTKVHKYELVTSNVNVLVKDLKLMFENIKSSHNCFKQSFEKEQLGAVIENVYKNYIQKLQESNSELLNEMNDMNQVLKQRGELISKLQEESGTNSKELLDKDNLINKLEAELDEDCKYKDELKKNVAKLKSELDSKEVVCRDLEEEIWKLKNESQGDVLSSSTLSRVEEVNRMTDVEESFEERYTKLKVLAVKLKKKVGDLTSQLESEHNKLQQYQLQMKTLKNIQGECDRLQDELDDVSKEKNELKKKLVLLTDEAESNKENCEILKQEKEKFVKEKQSFDIIKKELSSHVQSLKKELESSSIVKKQLDKNIEQLKEELLKKDNLHEDMIEKQKKLTEQLETQKVQVNRDKHSVLSLEIADYEKAVKELESQINSKDTRMKEIENHLDTQREMTKSLEDSRIESERTLHSQEDKIRDLSNKLETTSVELKQTKSSLDDCTRTLEEKTIAMENIQIQLSDLSLEKQKSEEKSRMNQEYLSRQLHMLEESLSNVRETLEQRDVEVDELRKEFDNYKVRAQSVLRQSQKDVTVSKQQNVLDELEQLKITSESMKSRLEDTSTMLKSLNEENKNLLEEKSRLYTRVQEMTNVINEVRQENLQLTDREHKLMSDSEEHVRMSKLHTDTLVACYQKQIEEMNECWKEEKENLEKELEKLRSKVEIQQDSIHHMNMSANNMLSGEMLDVILSEREEGEGSESVDSTSLKNTSTNLIPLERLLNDTEEADGMKSPVIDVLTLKDKLDKSENRVRHLATLLSEAESDSARLKQQNDLLKDEIRRKERNVEREKHAHNSEYLKNIVLKFVSLHNVDERLRLVPVLKTILMLSPEELVTLTNAAKGVGSDQGGNKGWGSYLPLWSSGQ